MGKHIRVEGKKDMKSTSAGLGVAHKKGRKKKKIVSVKGQMRSLQRLLNKEGLNPKAQKAEESKLETLRQKHEQQKQNERDRQLAKRYHMAKFFERIKIERKIEKLKREVAADDMIPEGKAAAVGKLAEHEEDLQYVMHFPKGEKFVSLLKDAATPEAQAQLDAERTRLRGLVRQQLADDRLLSEANEGRQDIRPTTSLQEHEIPAQAVTKRPPSKKATTGSVKRRTVAHRTVEPATAESPRFVKGDMAEEDDFFMQSGDDDLAIGKAQQTQATPELQQSFGKATAARKSEAWKGSKAERKQNGSLRTFQKDMLAYVEPQKDETAIRSRAEGGRKRKKKAK